MTLYELIDKANEVPTPKSMDFYNYVIWTSDDNGGFLRTCYTKKSKPLPDKELPLKVHRVLVAFEKDFNKSCLTLSSNGLTDTKLQFFYNITGIESLEATKKLSAEIGFPNFITIDV